jgi:hypothetical protein
MSRSYDHVAGALSSPVISARFIPDQSHYHAIEVEEEHDQMEGEFGEGFLLMLEQNSGLREQHRGISAHLLVDV